MGNLSTKALEAYDDMCTKQEDNLRNPSPLNLDRENIAFTIWEHASKLEEDFLKKKYKLHCTCVGDRNNKTFNLAAPTRQTINIIREIHYRDGRVVKRRMKSKLNQKFFFQRILAL